MKTVALDTNCFLRLLLNDVPDQASQVESLLTQAQNKKITLVVPQIVIFELHFALEKFYSFEKPSVIEKLKTIVGTPYLSVESSEIFSNAFSIYEAASTSFVDCFLLAFSQKEKAELFTFDKKLKKLIK